LPEAWSAEFEFGRTGGQDVTRAARWGKSGEGVALSGGLRVKVRRALAGSGEGLAWPGWLPQAAPVTRASNRVGCHGA